MLSHAQHTVAALGEDGTKLDKGKRVVQWVN